VFRNTWYETEDSRKLISAEPFRKTIGWRLTDINSLIEGEAAPMKILFQRKIITSSPEIIVRRQEQHLLLIGEICIH
jgi:hypothetical protein